MVSFNTLAVCVSALASVCCARSGHAHIHRGHLQARAGYNGTETTIMLPIGTGVVPPPVEHTFTSTSTVTQINTKFITVTYTLGNGAIKTTIITKTEETVQTVAHVKSTVTIAPIIETAAPSPAFIPPPVSVAAVAPVASVASVPSVVSSVKPKSTSTRTLVVTVNGSETATVSIVAETAPVNIAAEAVASSVAPACTAQTVYVPQYLTLYSTVTVTATPSAIRTPIMPPYSNSTMIESSKSFESTSTTTLSVYTTLYVQPSAV